MEVFLFKHREVSHARLTKLLDSWDRIKPRLLKWEFWRICTIPQQLFASSHNNCLPQGLTNYGPWTKPTLLPVFVYTILLEHNHAYLYQFFIYLLRFFPVTVWVVVTEAISPANPKIFTNSPLQKKFVDPWSNS